MKKMTSIPILNTTINGSGPIVVLLHGFMATSGYWSKVSSRLSKDYTVVSIDLLGFGKSPKPVRSRYDYEAHIKSINATLAGLGISKQFILMGHSMGALIALRYAKEYKQRVKRLVLANMPLLFTKEQAKQNILGENWLYNIALRPGMHALIWPLFRVFTALRVLPERIAGGVSSRSKYIFQSTGISRLRSLRNIIYAAKIEADLKALDVTTTILSGLQDNRAVYVSKLDKFRLGNHIKIYTITGGHHFPQTQPELFDQLLAS